MTGIEEGKSEIVVGIVSSNYLLRLGLQKIVEAETWIRLTGSPLMDRVSTPHSRENGHTLSSST